MFGNSENEIKMYELINERMIKFYAYASVISSVTALLFVLLANELHWGTAMGIMFGMYLNETKGDKMNRKLSIVGISLSLLVYIIYFCF